jgi:predicted ATPase
MATPAPAVPRLTYLRIKNYRALRDVEFRDLTPLTVLIGPNGSGKSTVLDALDFLAEAVRGNLTQAWEKRDRFRGMRTRGSEGDIEFELKVSLHEDEAYYFISFSEWQGSLGQQIIVKNETLELSVIVENEKIRVSHLSFMSHANTDSDDKRLPVVNKSFIGGNKEPFVYTNPQSPRITEVDENTEWMNEQHEINRMGFLLIYLNSYRLLHLTDDHLKGYSDAGPREKLSPNGDNLPNVLYYLHERHPEVLAKITAQMRRWVPGLADIVPEITSDERLLLRFKDAPFEKPLPAQYMSGGTMRLAALLTLLYEPGAAGLLGIEEPENELHPQLLPQLAEELIAASEHRQLLVATHAPFLLDALEPSQVWILHRDASGYTQATRAADIPGVPELVEDGSPLGYLWTSNSLPVGNPLAPPANAR